MQNSRFPEAEMANACCVREPYIPHYTDPIEGLWAEVMFRSIADLSITSARVEAVYWFISDIIEIGSFRWCCLVLNLPPSAVRSKYHSLIYAEFLGERN